MSLGLENRLRKSQAPGSIGRREQSAIEGAGELAVRYLAWRFIYALNIVVLFIPPLWKGEISL